MTDWLQNLKPGDLVLVTGNKNGFNNAPDTTTGRVFRVTKTTIILQAGKDENSAGYKFNRTDGYQRTSDSYNRRKLVERTPEAFAKHDEAWRRYRLINTLKSFDYNKLSTAGLIQVHTILSKEDREIGT